MPLEDLIRYNSNQGLSANQKCSRAIAWIQDARNHLDYDGIIAYLRIVDKYEANSSKFFELPKNKLSSHAANNHRTGLRHVWMKHERNKALDYQQFIELYRLDEREDFTYPWIHECNISFDRIKNFVADKEEGRKASIFTLWLGEEKNKISEQELFDLFFDGGVFAEFSEQNKKKILDQYVKSNQGILPTDARLRSIYGVRQEQAVAALQSPLVRPAQSSLAARSTSAQSITVPAKQEQKTDSPFVQLIKELATTLPLQRDAKIKDWFSKNNLPFKEFESFFTKENPNNVLSLTDSTQNTLLISWFEKEGNNLDPHEFIHLLRPGKLFTIESLRTGAFQILSRWFVDTRNVNLTIRLSTFFADMIKVFSDSELLELLK